MLDLIQGAHVLRYLVISSKVCSLHYVVLKRAAKILGIQAAARVSAPAVFAAAWSTGKPDKTKHHGQDEETMQVIHYTLGRLQLILQTLEHAEQPKHGQVLAQMIWFETELICS